jgi:hypothetical protein
MQAELSRSLQRLRLQDYQAPFYVAYRVVDEHHLELGGRYGALFEDRDRQARELHVDLRVGSYELDSSSPEEATLTLDGDGPTWTAPRDAPLDGDAVALRNALWLATDERYKEALASYFKKRSKAVYRADDPDRAPSFSHEAPAEHVDPPLPFPFERDRWRAVIREVTGGFRSHPEIFDADLKVTAEREVRWFASTEGSALVTEHTLYGAHLHAVTRAPDGQLLEDGRDFYAPTEGGLPSLEALRRSAELVVEAAGVLFHEAVGHRLEGDRVEDDQEGQTFRGQVGRAILPTFLSVVDDPTLREASGVPLNGSYAFDDQGVPAQRTVLVRDGRLETYLLSRRPVRPFEHSNGHGRAQGTRASMARMSNLLVQSGNRLGREALKAALMAEARRQGKPFGLVVHDITGGNTNTLSWGYQAFKGTPRLVYRVDARTGEEELVRGVEMVGTPLSSVKRVLATGDELRVFNGYCGAESGYVPVSTVAPAMLVGEIELQRVARARERGPILPAPWSERTESERAGP